MAAGMAWALPLNSSAWSTGDLKSVTEPPGDALCWKGWRCSLLSKEQPPEQEGLPRKLKAGDLVLGRPCWLFLTACRCGAPVGRQCEPTPASWLFFMPCVWVLALTQRCGLVSSAGEFTCLSRRQLPGLSAPLHFFFFFKLEQLQ